MSGVSETKSAAPEMHSGARKRVPALDSVRAIAITFVVLRHAWPTLFGAGGFAGVEIFFVLSGYLITNILLSDERSAVMSYRRFYFNRILRLYPALVVLCIGMGVVVLTWNPLHEDTGRLVDGLIVALTYTADIPHLPGLLHLGEASHLWTLAIEEQFYLIWPVVLITCARHGRLRTLGWWALGLGILLNVLTVLYGEHGSVGLASIYTWPTPWILTLIAGSLLAIGTVSATTARPAAWVAFAGLAALCFVPDPKSHAYGYLLVLPAVAVLALGLVANAASERPLEFLLHPAVRYLGKISYAVYLWDYPFTTWISGPAAIPLSIIAASASFYLIERPFLALRRAPKLRTVEAGAGRSADSGTRADVGTPMAAGMSDRPGMHESRGQGVVESAAPAPGQNAAPRRAARRGGSSRRP